MGAAQAAVAAHSVEQNPPPLEGSQHDRFPGIGDQDGELPDFEEQGGGSPPPTNKRITGCHRQ
eukprot:3308531-Karenia_brevis.AAC.1